MNPIIGISGVATSGKDTFGTLLIEELQKLQIPARRFALADELKKQVAPFILDHHGIDVFNCTADQKAFIRPILVNHGELKRSTSEGTYWLTLLDKTIREAQEIEPLLMPIVTDIRYAFYPNDELYWVKNKNGLIVHLERYTYSTNALKHFEAFNVSDLFVATGPANETEAKHDGALKQKADFNIPWITAPSTQFSEINCWCRPYVDNFVGSLLIKKVLKQCY